MTGNENDFGGFTEKELYVPRKYETYKEEILSHITKKEYELIMTKATEYSKSTKVKSITPNFQIVLLNYEIAKGDHMKLDHIISLILYCDYSKYCTAFSSTFRKISITERMEEVKKRNGLFWFQSKSFREAVECFGVCNVNKYVQDGMDPISGPFYSGLDLVLAIPEFSLRLCSPTSTSVHMEVSLNFSKRTGIIIQLNNNKPPSFFLPIFDVSWISRYPDEDERVFTGLFVLFLVLT